jgi:hypothetical protein
MDIGVGAASRGTIELVDVGAVFVEPDAARLAGTIRENEDVLRHCEFPGGRFASIQTIVHKSKYSRSTACRKNAARRGAATAEREVILDVMNNGLATTLFTSILATLMTGSG